MMSAFFHFQHTLSRFFKSYVRISNKFFLKYEVAGRGGTSLKKPSLIRVNRTIKNILSNHIPHEIIICDDRHPLWINNRVKELINEKNNTSLCYLNSNKDAKLFTKFEYL